MKTVMSLALSFVLVGGIGAANAGGADGAKKTQIVRLTVVDNAYVVTPSKVTKGVPVKMEADPDTVRGCAGTVVLSAFGVKKTIKKDDATIEFTPDKSGTVEIVCGMGMVKGALVVTAR